MKNNKILIIINGIFGENPSLSGGDVRALQIAKQWQKKNIEIELLAGRAAKRVSKDFGLNVYIHHLPCLRKKKTRFDFVLRTIQAALFAPKSLSSFKGGAVYSINSSLLEIIPGLVLKLKYGEKIKWAVVVHMLMPSPPWKRKSSKIIYSIIFFINQRISLWLANRYADVIFSYGITVNRLKKLGLDKNKIIAVANGVNFDETRLAVENIKEKKYHAVFMNRLQPVKGIFDLLEIWKKVTATKRDAKMLVLGGTNDEQDFFKRLVKKEKMEKNIEVCGYINKEKEKFKKIAQAKVFILTSYEEGWPLTINEVMAVGTPIIAYGIKELRYIWQKEIEWVSLGKTGIFSKKIVKLLNSPQKRKELKKNGLDFVKKHSWEKIAAKELKAIFEK